MQEHVHLGLMNLVRKVKITEKKTRLLLLVKRTKTVQNEQNFKIGQKHNNDKRVHLPRKMASNKITPSETDVTA